MSPMTLVPVPGIPPLQPGDDLPGILADALKSAAPAHGDVLVVAQKIVSKAENRYVDLATVTPSPRAVELAAVTQKDPRLVEVILSDSDEVVRARPGPLIVRHRLGWGCAKAGLARTHV